MNKFSDEGFECNLKGEICFVKMYALVSVDDSVARPTMQGLKQFNGRFGCGWCLHPGIRSNNCSRYVFIFPPAEPRTHENTLKSIDKLFDEKLLEVEGVIMAPTLMKLNFFDLIIGFVPDLMHASAAGAGKQISEVFISKLDSTDKACLDAYLQSIRVPSQLGRLPRPLKKMADWKSKEWENFILYYSIPLFSMFYNEEFMKY